MSIREFSTSVAQTDQSKSERSRDVKVKVDGREIEFKGPTSAQLAMVIFGAQGTFTQQVAAFINFFFACLPKQYHNEFRARLWDDEDPFDDAMIADIVKHLMEEWSGNPTQPSPASTPTQPPTGSTSTETASSEE